MTELESLIALNQTPGLGNRGIKRLLEKFGSAKKILQASAKDLAGEKLASSEVARQIRAYEKFDLKKEFDLIKKHGVEVISAQDPSYPACLQEIPDSPVILYVKGTLEKNRPAIAMVGSRRASFYGLATAEKFSGRLAELGIIIVSGMARGIDAAAHRGSLKAKGLTYAVLGCGLSHVYPPEHKKLFEEIAQNGAVISEFSMETKPFAYNFPRRNRIISGLALGVVVVEASQKSGALITADFALEQGREVFAVPGKVDNPLSQGVNNLIKQGAKLMTSVDDILEELKPNLKQYIKSVKKDTEEVSRTPAASLSEEESRLYSDIDRQGTHIDELAALSGLPVSRTMAVLLNLELKQKIKQLPGKIFARL